ncbi:22959_t:CDS:2, partial [Racocetra persica]
NRAKISEIIGFKIMDDKPSFHKNASDSLNNLDDFKKIKLADTTLEDQNILIFLDKNISDLSNSLVRDKIKNTKSENASAVKVL